MDHWVTLCLYKHQSIVPWNLRTPSSHISVLDLNVFRSCIKACGVDAIAIFIVQWKYWETHCKLGVRILTRIQPQHSCCLLSTLEPVRSTLPIKCYSVLCAICFNSPSQSWLFLFFGFTPRSANLNLDIPLPVTWYLSQHLFSVPSAKAGLVQMCLPQRGILPWDFFFFNWLLLTCCHAISFSVLQTGAANFSIYPFIYLMPAFPIEFNNNDTFSKSWPF